MACFPWDEVEELLGTELKTLGTVEIFELLDLDEMDLWIKPRAGSKKEVSREALDRAWHQLLSGRELDLPQLQAMQDKAWFVYGRHSATPGWSELGIQPSADLAYASPWPYRANRSVLQRPGYRISNFVAVPQARLHLRWERQRQNTNQVPISIIGPSKRVLAMWCL